MSSVYHLPAYSSSSLRSENKVKVMAPKTHTPKLTGGERHRKTYTSMARVITVHYGAGSSWLRLETGRRLVGRSQRGHFGHCPALPCLALGRTPNSHTVYPTRLYPCKITADKLMKGDAPKVDISHLLPEKPSNVRLLGTRPLSRHGA